MNSQGKGIWCVCVWRGVGGRRLAFKHVLFSGVSPSCTDVLTHSGHLGTQGQPLSGLMVTNGKRKNGLWRLRAYFISVLYFDYLKSP